MMLENLSTSDQVVWDEDGKEHVIAGRAIIGPIGGALAKMFIDGCEGRVIEYIPELIPTQPGVEDIWVANNTGNPNFPKTYEYKITNKLTKQQETVSENHPNAEPRTLHFEFDRGQVKTANNVINVPNQLVRLPAFSRRRVPETVARAWLSSQAMGDPAAREALVISRQPSEREPNESWDLDEVVAFALCLHKDFEHKFQARSVKMMGKTAKPSSADILNEKRRVLKALYFFLINPEINLPPKKAVEKKLSELK